MRDRILVTGQCFVLAIAALAVPSAAEAQTYTFSTLYNFKDNGTDPQNSTAP